MDFREFLFVQRISSSSLAAATAIDRILRGAAVDTAPIRAFVTDVGAVYGPVPQSVLDAIESRDPLLLEGLKKMSLEAHDLSLAYSPPGPFSDDDFDALMAQSVPITAEFLSDIRELVGDVDVDLDAPLEGHVSI